MSNAPSDRRDISSDFWITSSVSALTLHRLLARGLVDADDVALRLARPLPVGHQELDAPDLVVARRERPLRLRARRPSTRDRMISVPIAPYFWATTRAVRGAAGGAAGAVACATTATKVTSARNIAAQHSIRRRDLFVARRNEKDPRRTTIADSRWHGDRNVSSSSRSRHLGRPAHRRRPPAGATAGRRWVTIGAKRTSRASRPADPASRVERAVSALDRSLRRRPRFDRTRTDAGLRVLHFSVQQDHVHAIVEADSHDDLDERRAEPSVIRIALPAVSRHIARVSRVWGNRYHARARTTPRRGHSHADRLQYFCELPQARCGRPPASTHAALGPWFDGWRRPPPPPARRSGCPSAPARTWQSSAESVGAAVVPSSSMRVQSPSA